MHGYAGAGDNFNRLPQQFAHAGWFVRVMRLPGHGTSPRDMEKVTADELLEAVRSEVAELREEHERIVLVGHSMGGALCTLAAAETPVDGLILGGAYFGITDRWYYILSGETWTRFSSKLMRWVYKGHLFTQVNDDSAKPNITSYTWLPTKAGLTLIEIGRRASAPTVLERVKCTVLMFHAPGDIAASSQAAENAFGMMGSKDKELVWLEKSNHHVFWDYDHEVIERRVSDYVGLFAQSEETLNLPNLDSDCGV
ncbi:MAG: alpha/beta fold hydrolase [Candidatus Hydrogenedentes bacterium]|nr:alpha/beta fold hydrolase [Candidatus Hydrogenedentota bacterium]